jgi:hypothetical protein
VMRDCERERGREREREGFGCGALCAEVRSYYELKFCMDGEVVVRV